MSYADGYTDGRKLADEVLVAKIERLKTENNDLGKLVIVNQKKAIVLRKQLGKVDAVIEAGKVIANQIIGEAVYRPSTSTGDADKFFELLADYKKGKGNAAQIAYIGTKGAT